MDDDDWSDLRASLALVRLAWPQLATLFSFLFALLMRYPLWFVGLAVFVVMASVWQVAADVAQNPGRRFDFTGIDCLLVGSGWAASLLSMRWWSIERAQHLESGALLTLAHRDLAISTPELAWYAVVTQWMSCAVALVAGHSVVGTARAISADGRLNLQISATDARSWIIRYASQPFPVNAIVMSLRASAALQVQEGAIGHERGAERTEHRLPLVVGKGWFEQIRRCLQHLGKTGEAGPGRQGTEVGKPRRKTTVQEHQDVTRIGGERMALHQWIEAGMRATVRRGCSTATAASSAHRPTIAAATIGCTRSESIKCGGGLAN